MARFDIYALPDAGVPLVVEVQADLLAALSTTIVVPMVNAQGATEHPLPRLKPTITVMGQDYILVATDLTVLPRTELGPKVATIPDQHHLDVTQALDVLFHGF